MSHIKASEGKRGGYETQRGQKEDNSITPFNLASKVNGLFMSETVEKNLLKFSTSCFFPLALPPTFGILVADCRLNSKEAKKKRQSPRCTRCRIHLKWGKNGWAVGKEQDVPFLWQPSDAESMGLHCTRCKTASATRFVHSKATRHRHQHGISNTVRTQQSSEVYTQHGTAWQSTESETQHSKAVFQETMRSSSTLYCCCCNKLYTAAHTLLQLCCTKDAVAWKQ